jgi:DNA (cytosine-5-)-methyltransferase
MVHYCTDIHHVPPEPYTDLYDVRRLAELLGVKRSTIRTMRRRGQLPEPTASDINGGAVWSREIIEEFFMLKESTLSIPSVNKSLPQVVDLFSGCGGLSLGFQMAGFDVIAGFDNWNPAIETYTKNLGHSATRLDLGDVEATIAALEPYFISSEKPAIIGGPPCQDFSSAGKRKEGARADLTEKYAAVVTRLMPPFFVMENVARAQHAGAFKRAVGMMEKAGYTVAMIVLDASKCGVPQVRKRLITIGTLDVNKTIDILSRLENGQSSRQTTLRDYFGDALGTEHYYRHPRSYARRAIFSIDEPSPTIRGVNRPIPQGYPGHPGDSAPIKEARPLTTSERARIQTFPEEFQFVGARTNVEQMIGNAVPPLLGKYVAEAIAPSFDDYFAG